VAPILQLHRVDAQELNANACPSSSQKGKKRRKKKKRKERKGRDKAAGQASASSSPPFQISMNRRHVHSLVNSRHSDFSRSEKEGRKKKKRKREEKKQPTPMSPSRWATYETTELLFPRHSILYLSKKKERKRRKKRKAKKRKEREEKG